MLSVPDEGTEGLLWTEVYVNRTHGGINCSLRNHLPGGNGTVRPSGFSKDDGQGHFLLFGSDIVLAF